MCVCVELPPREVESAYCSFVVRCKSVCVCVAGNL